MSFFGKITDLGTTALTAGQDGKGGFDTGDAVNAGLDAVASAVPFGALAKDLLDNLGLSENIDLVSKYGFSSWGGSNSPEKMGTHFAENVFPKVHQISQGINQGQIAETFNQLEVLFQVLIDSHTHKKSAHSNAKSTRLANQWGIDTAKGLRTKLRGEIANLKTKGFDIKSATSTIDAKNRYNMYDNLFIHWNHQSNTVTVPQYIVTGSSDVKVDKEGKIVAKEGGGSAGILAVVGFGLYKIFG